MNLYLRFPLCLYSKALIHPQGEIYFYNVQSFPAFVLPLLKFLDYIAASNDKIIDK
jgi:hypothetical protein